MINNFLEYEKEKVFQVAKQLLDSIDFEKENNWSEGRPSAPTRDILKSLIVMSYNGMSYRRSQSDLRKLYSEGYIRFFPKKSTLNKYMFDSSIRKIVEELITVCAFSFVDVINTIIVDSTWFCRYIKMTGATHHRKSANVSLPSLKKCVKVHSMCCKDTQVVLCARATLGTVSDITQFIPMFEFILKRGFKIANVLGDKGYSSRENYRWLQEQRIKGSYLMFKDHEDTARSRSMFRKERLLMLRNRPDEWNEMYRFRSLIESMHSAWKRKGNNYIRSKKLEAAELEVLLRVLWHNLAIVAKNMT
ncbi:MAG: transposase [Nanoarchaeota archaeon]